MPPSNIAGWRAEVDEFTKVGDADVPLHHVEATHYTNSASELEFYLDVQLGL